MGSRNRKKIFAFLFAVLRSLRNIFLSAINSLPERQMKEKVARKIALFSTGRVFCVHT